MVVKSIMHRNDPIILGVVTWKLPVPFPFAIPVLAGEIWNVLDYAGIPDVKGVWFGLGYVWSSFMVIAIKQSYPGHAKQAALAALSCRASTVGGQYVVMVDDDIDITNEKEVLWAICNRAGMNSFHVIDGLRTMAGAPTMPRDAMERGLMVGGRIIIDACWPYERRDRFPVTSRLSPQYQEEIMKKWPSLF
jgi:UbiD family decarboxylase